jgi:hypothetical protein
MPRVSHDWISREGENPRVFLFQYAKKVSAIKEMRVGEENATGQRIVAA